MKSEESLRKELSILLKEQAEKVISNTEDNEYKVKRRRVHFLETVLELDIYNN